MALTYDQINAVTTEYFEKTLTKQCYDDSPLWVKARAQNRVTLDGGIDIRYPMRYRRLDFADAMDPDAQMVYKTKSTRTACVQDWKTYSVQGLFTWDESIKNSGKEKIIDLIGEKVTEMKDDIYHRFATDLYTANPSGLGIDPLPTIVDSADTFAGVAVADASTWAAWEDASTTVLSLYGGAGSWAYYMNLATLGKNHPTMIVTTRNIYSKFMSLFEGQRMRSDNDLADAGFDNCMFMNASVVADSYCPASTTYGLNWDRFEFMVHSDYNFKTTPWFSLEQNGLPNHVAKVLSWVGNLKCDLRRTNWKMTTLNWAV